MNAEINFPDADAVSYPNKASWLAARGSWIGSSDSPMLYRAVPDGEAVLVARKTGMVPDFEPTAAMETGHRVERMLLIELAERRHVAHTPYLIAVSRRWPWMSASPDGVEFDENGKMIALVECKFTKRLIEYDAGDNGWHSINWDRGERPLRWVVQMQHQMAVTGLDRVISPVFIGADGRIELGEYPRNDEWIEKHVAKCKKVYDEIQTSLGNKRNR